MNAARRRLASRREPRHCRARMAAASIGVAAAAGEAAPGVGADKRLCEEAIPLPPECRTPAGIPPPVERDRSSLDADSSSSSHCATDFSRSALLLLVLSTPLSEYFKGFPWRPPSMKPASSSGEPVGNDSFRKSRNAETRALSRRRDGYKAHSAISGPSTSPQRTSFPAARSLVWHPRAACVRPDRAAGPPPWASRRRASARKAGCQVRPPAS